MMPVRKRARLPRPLALWFATAVVALHCAVVIVGFVYAILSFVRLSWALGFPALGILVAASVLACQWIAVFLSYRTEAWFPAGLVGLLFLFTGGGCFFSTPLMAFEGGTSPLTFPKPFFVVGYGLWGAAGLATGVIMLLWARQLYRRQVLRWLPPCPRYPRATMMTVSKFDEARS